MEGKRLHVKENGKVIYDIVIEDSFAPLKEELKKLSTANRKVCIVTEEQVASHYLQEVKDSLAGSCRYLTEFVFQPGEENKNLSTVNKLYQFLIEEKFDRKDLLLALGGGVTGDLTGFAAATYLRGIDFVQIPSSLLSQVDSSIGGKTGVDYMAYKNMVGAFYMPKLVYINISTLQTLSEVQFRSGLGEVIKHGLIRDAEYYRYILEHKEEIKKRDREVLACLVEGSCKIKRAVVEEDPKELGIRAYLNFGHTIGHAVEKLMEFSMTHGECVGVGSVLACKMSMERGMITAQEYDSVKDIYRYFAFPDIPMQLDADQIIETMKHDKKMEQGVLKFILLEALGCARIFRDVEDQEVKSVLAHPYYGE